ncbi:MAG: hypothetical protein AABN33_29380 [Acidobacteriota bacterium]
MKIKIVRDAKGEVIATADEPKGLEMLVEPELDKDHVLEEVDAKPSYAFDLDDFYKKYRKVKKS